MFRHNHFLSIQGDEMFENEILTNKNKVFVDENGKRRIASRGSHTLRDWADNALIASGLGRKTHGYKSLK